EGFFAWQDKLWQKINLRNEKQSYQDGLFRMDLLTFDEVPVREALLNAVAHRDYRLGGSVFVKQYPQRLEVVSPGGLPPGITPSNILNQQNPRNRRLAEALEKCGLIERSGQGMNLMFESAIRQGKQLPSFAGTDTHEVRLTLDGLVRSPAFVRYLERLGERTLKSFSTDDFLTLDAVHREQTLLPNLKDCLPALVAAGAVEVVGRGKGARYILSAGLYAVMGASGTHTRQRGLDHETNKALLLKHLTKHRDEGAPLAELRQVLPALSSSAVQGLLHELREEGLVTLVGLRRWARWKLAAPAVSMKASL
ncbi:MAG: transcriptional regulator, partial [Burkholderiales bacterium]